MSIEKKFDISFVAPLAAKEKQIQQNYRPYIGVHKWFARRPGTLFRSLLLSEFLPEVDLADSFAKGTTLQDITVADPFMGGGTIVVEGNRLGANVIGADINPMAFWVTRQELAPLDRDAFRTAAEQVIQQVDREIGYLYRTECGDCGNPNAEVKYFFWVKQQECAACGTDFDLFPGYLVAENSRHTHFVLHCPHCKRLVEVGTLPAKGGVVNCPSCSREFGLTGPAVRNKYSCPKCGHVGKYPAEARRHGPPRHRLFGMEYHCPACRELHKGRYFKTPDPRDLELECIAQEKLSECLSSGLIPDDLIPEGDETNRLHRWGYDRYRDLFNPRQLLGLATLMRHVKQIPDLPSRHALATVFSDTLRYQNMLCRYDTYALKCQDIFAVHGFPVGLVQCENNLMGIPAVGSGGFRHFVEKYDRAKAYCEEPFETIQLPKGKKRLVPTVGEFIKADFVTSPADISKTRTAHLIAGSIEDVCLGENSLDGVFTDPPYFDNVQYAELMDFCFVWLRILLNGDLQEFMPETTRTVRELTGNVTTGKGLLEFTEGLSAVYTHAARALKPGAPFVFTYHHNDLSSYASLVVAILDAQLVCTATLPCPGEMGASLHISGTGSSTLDTVFVCRNRQRLPFPNGLPSLMLWDDLRTDVSSLANGGVTPTIGDLRCLAYGHVTRYAIGHLRKDWKLSITAAERLSMADKYLRHLEVQANLPHVIADITELVRTRGEKSPLGD